MWIGKFHAMIQSRITWIIFLVVIVFSFVIWGTPFLFASREERERGAAGVLNGRPVTRAEYWDALQHVRLAIALAATGQMPSLDERTEPTLRRLAWQRLASLREAARLGIVIRPDEVQDAIRSQPMFQHEGRFRLEAYRGFVNRLLGETGLGEPFFEEHVAQELALQRLRMITAQAVLAPPADIARVFSVLEDVFQIEYLELPPSIVETNIALSEAQIADYFSRHMTNYAIPPRVVVQYVHFRAADHLSEVPPPEANDIEDYYDEHRQQYTIETQEIVTNLVEAPTPPGTSSTNTPATAQLATQTVRRVRPLDEVRPAIVEALRQRRAMDRAEQRALEFVGRISPDRPTRPLSFEQAAREFGVEVRETPPLLRDVPLATVDAGLRFNRAAFELREAPDERFSLPVRGESGYFVLWLKERLPSRIPELADVRVEVERDAREEAISAALDTCAESLLHDLRAGKTTLAQAAARWNLPLQQPPEFTATRMPTNHPAVERLMGELATCNAGEYTPVVRGGPDGTTRLVAHVIQRKPAPPGRLMDMSRNIADLILREREAAYHRAFEAELLKRGQLQDRMGRSESGADAREDRASEGDSSDS
ncbi:MAG: SurA N-terminal domain-containing protein [Kiritimatiellae bacterium]|nr:SurA N-terminal domain-containing protein [Kiritimatiellia bacterium]